MSRIEDQVCIDIQQRADMGLRKYGVSMERDDLRDAEWLQHLYEELLDAAVYLRRIIDDKAKAV